MNKLNKPKKKIIKILEPTINTNDINEISLDVILETFDLNLSKEKIFELLSIKYINFDKYVLSKDDIDFVYEIINFYKTYEFDKTLELINNISKSSKIIDSKFIFKTDFFIEQSLKSEENKDKIKHKLDIVEGNTMCEKCKSKKVFSQGNQTRSGDEGLTYFYFCSNCGNKWKQNT
jgi:DNA-directed RNA polymerase subunit M/transcription elongation factor TFIIS